jgi:hypothetical protein
MRLLIAVMFFFGTLLAAALLALGEPAAAPATVHGWWQQLATFAQQDAR